VQEIGACGAVEKGHRRPAAPSLGIRQSQSGAITNPFFNSPPVPLYSRHLPDGRGGDFPKTVRRHPGAHPATAAGRRWRGAFRMSQQTAQSRSCSDKPGGSSAPGGGNGAFLGLSEAPSPVSKGLGELVPPPTPGKSVKTPSAKGAWGCTMALHRPAAESGKVIWETSNKGGHS